MTKDTKAGPETAGQRRSPRPEIERIGGRKLSPATLMMGHGYDPALSEGSLKPPIFLTSTFVFPSAAAGKRHFEGVTGKRPGGAEGLVYSRFNGPNQEILEDRLAIWEEAEDALAFSSGMSAIATLFLSMVEPGDTIVHSGPLYAATETLIARILGRFGVKWLDFPAGATRAEIDAVLTEAAKGKVALIYLESPANPTNALVDVEAVAASRDAIFTDPATRPPIAIDNTFLGPLWHKPLRHGADIVVYSLTKYAGGHSDLVAGGLLGSKAHINTIRLMRNTIGTICDPNTAWMLLRSLETLELRMSRAGENAAKVCAFLASHPKVERVGYLGFLEGGKDARQADIYRRHCTGAGSTFSLYLKGGEAESFRFLDALRIAKLAVSLGGTETLASHPAAMTHLSVPDARKQALGITDNLVRISIGVEDADDLIADFAQALDAI
ncbi:MULTISPECIES: cystathionine gamma-synthase family protein [unclassified Sphingomonas]|mgnify:FL=1|uniref:cystathionine gamma-synthase family protein n=1 Tax=unclassified Sphingomonas TaxID=196159 RepID=UPI000925A38B|nr:MULTISPECIES: cystathionine gamma-synthase family protein [unclassified Sphingomonas]MBN8849022.1 cystathionine gamma-synthase family protein [Sphingomonas sp.]MBS0285191.1 cystathionine gamma-synthase family protein [Pseudomonadota bacterium]OJV34667.1 MAG: methionine gamma-lyase [Sphingomonas sp. 67-36]